ncbi:transposable element Tcb1 transposase [Trichonephila clavipes]|nr:transposable element Tcb1 transposase [Trichonephila clavipes]
MTRHPGASFQQDVRPYTAHISRDYLRVDNILPWPVWSLGSSPVEHVLDMVGRHIQAPQNIADLEQKLVNSWQNGSHDNISNLNDILSRRIQACIAARGSFTHYWF